MSYKLFTDDGNFRAFKALIAAEYNGVSVETSSVKLGVDNVTAEFLKKSPLGRVPVLETAQVRILFSSYFLHHFFSSPLFFPPSYIWYLQPFSLPYLVDVFKYHRDLCSSPMLSLASLPASEETLDFTAIASSVLPKSTSTLYNYSRD